MKTATVHTMNVDNIVFDNVNITGTGGYGLWFDQGSYYNTQHFYILW